MYCQRSSSQDAVGVRAHPEVRALRGALVVGAREQRGGVEGGRVA